MTQNSIKNQAAITAEGNADLGKKYKRADEDQQIVKKICAILLTKPMDGVKYKTTKSQERSGQDDEEVLLLLLLFYQGLPAFCEC